MELKVNVDGYVRVVCGVTEDTTCQDLVIALAHAMGRTGRFSLLEKWRVQERSLPPWERPLQVLQKWGEYAAEVQFTLQRTDRDEVRRATDAINKIGISGPEHCGRNFSPPPPTESAVKRSLTFSGAHSYSQPAKMGGATTFAQHRVPASTTEKSAPFQHHHHQHHQHSKYSLEKCPQRDSHHYDQPDTPHSQLPKPHSQKPHTFPQHHLGHKSHSAQSNYPQNINKPSNTSKPISSIKPQPKPRTLPLRTITEKLPSRTVGTVSPIQTKRQLTTIGHTTSSRVPLSQDEARPSLEQITHDIPETTKVDDNKNRNNYYNNTNHNNVYSNDDDEYNITTTTNNNDSNNSGLQILDNFNSEEHSIDSGPPDPRTTLNRNIEKPRTKYCFANDIMSMKASNLAQIEEYDLDKNFPLSLRSSPEANNLGENYAECYVIQGENEFEGQPPEDPDSQALLQLINIQHEKLELQKVRIKDIDLEIISAEELIEREKEIQELQSLSDEYEEELVELEPWPQILEEEQCIKQAFDLEMDSCKQKITDCEDRLQKAQSRVSELSRELEQEVFKIEQEISDIQEKIKRGLEANDDYEGAIDRIDKEISELDFELEKKQAKESNLCEEVKQLNLKELGQKPTLEATKLSETGEAAGILILKLLEKQQQFTRQGSGSKKGFGSKMEDEAVSTTTTTTTTTSCTEPKSVTTNDGVWV